MKTGIIGAVPRSIKNERHVENIYKAAWNELKAFKHKRRLRRPYPTADLPGLRPTPSYQPQQDLSPQTFISVVYVKWYNPPVTPGLPHRVKTYLVKHT